MGKIFMEKKNISNIQDKFINHLISKELLIRIYLISGIKLEGIIVSSDENCLVIKKDDHSILVYKQALSTITPYDSIKID